MPLLIKAYRMEKNKAFAGYNCISIMYNLNPPQLAQWKETADKNDLRIVHMEDVFRD